MLILFRTELRKILPYRTVWVILGIFTVLLFLLMQGGSNISINGQKTGSSLYKFPDVLYTLTWVAGYFNLLLGILLIILISDEYSFRTMRQQVIDGYFRSDIIASKTLVMVSLATYGALFVGSLGIGFGLLYGENNQAVSGTSSLLFYFIQVLGYLSVAMFFAFLIRKTGLAIMAFIVYCWGVEGLLQLLTNDNIDKYFPMKVFSSLTPTPGRDLLAAIAGETIKLTPQQAAIPAVAYIIFFTLLSYLLLKMRDL